MLSFEGREAACFRDWPTLLHPVLRVFFPPVAEGVRSSYHLLAPGAEAPPYPPTCSCQVNLSTGKVGGVGSSVLSELGTLQVRAITGRGRVDAAGAAASNVVLCPLRLRPKAQASN